MRILYEYRSQLKISVWHEFVVMPDHFHLLPLTVGSDMTVEKAVQFIKGGFAFRCGTTRELGFRAPVWQTGFSEVRVLDAEAYCGIAIHPE